MIAKLRSALGNRAEAWAKKRHGTQPSPVRFHRKRIYILPTKTGITFSVMLFVMLLGSMNYNNSMGLVLVFSLASFVLVTMHQCHRNLLGLTLSYSIPQAVHAGEIAHVPVTLVNEHTHRHAEIELHLKGEPPHRVTLAPLQTMAISLPFRTTQRGMHALPRLMVSTRYPSGLFRAWTWVYWNVQCLVYPRAAGPLPLPPLSNSPSHGSQQQQAGEDEMVDLREFQSGDSLKHVAWKHLARSDKMYTKLFAGETHRELWLNWNDAGPGETEARLSQLSQWIVTLRDNGNSFGMTLPDADIESAQGPTHAHRCLHHLATFEPAV